MYLPDCILAHNPARPCRPEGRLWPSDDDDDDVELPIQAWAHSQKSWTEGHKVFYVSLTLCVCQFSLDLRQLLLMDHRDRSKWVSFNRLPTTETERFNHPQACLYWMNGAVGHPMFGLRGEGRHVRSWDLGVAHLLTGVGGRHPDLGLIEMYSKSVFQEPGGALTYRAREVCTPVLFHRVPVHSEKQMGEMVRDSACKELINKNLTSVFTDQCTMQ